MSVSGSKRVRERGVEAQHEAQRSAVVGGDGKPAVAQGPQRLGLDSLLPDLYVPIFSQLDLRSYRECFTVSKRLYTIADNLRLSREFRARIDMSALIGDARKWSAHADKLAARFSCAGFTLDHKNQLEHLYALAEREEIETLKLHCDSDGIKLDQLLPELDKAVSRRTPHGGHPPSCELLLPWTTDFGDANKSFLRDLQYLKITALCANRQDWLELTPHMPALKELTISFTPHLTPEAAQVGLESRKAPIHRMIIEEWNWRAADAAGFFATLERLQVRHVQLENYDEDALCAWAGYKLESLELKGNFVREEMYAVDNLIQGCSVATLILSDDECEPREMADLSIMADNVQKNDRLRSVEVRINPLFAAGGPALLEAVIRNRNIRHVSLPYPIEIQKSVEALLARRPEPLTITRTNDYRNLIADLEQLGREFETELAKNQ